MNVDGYDEAASQAAKVSEWTSKHLRLSLGDRKGFACHLTAVAVLPLSAAQAYELLTHPDNSNIFRGIDECTYRHIISDDGCGKLQVEVENVSVWRLLFMSGRIATRLVARQDYHAGTMQVQLAPDLQNGPRTPGCKQVPLEKLEAHWSVKPLSKCLQEADGLFPALQPEEKERVDECYCLVTLKQSLQPWGIPGFLHGTFKNFAKGQAQQTFEDIVAEALKISQGFPSLCPYEEVCMKEITPEEETGREDEDAGEGVADLGVSKLGVTVALGKGVPLVDPGDTLASSSASCSVHGGGSEREAVSPAVGGDHLKQRRRSLQGYRLCNWEFWESELEDLEMDGVSESNPSVLGSVEGSCTPMEDCSRSEAGSDIMHHLMAAVAASKGR